MRIYSSKVERILNNIRKEAIDKSVDSKLDEISRSTGADERYRERLSDELSDLRYRQQTEYDEE